MGRKLEVILALLFVASVLSLAPFSTKRPVFASVTHPLQPTDILGNFNTPYPTNAFWTNAVLANGAGVVGQGMVPALPYLVNMRSNGVAITMPSLFGASNVAGMAFGEDFRVFFQQLSGSPTRRVSKYDDMSVTMAWNTNQLEVPIVPGSPYFSFKVDNLTPFITSEHVIRSINGQSAGTISGNKFVIVLDGGPTGILYTSSSVSITWTSSIINFNSRFTGVIRLANSAIGESELDKYRDALVVGGTADIVFGQGNNANLEITWQTEGQGQLLMMALPHHQDMFSQGSSSSASIRTLKGTMTGRVGSQWVLPEILPELRWNSANPIDSDKIGALRAALIADDAAQNFFPGDPYFHGKKVARVARLVLIADQLGESQITTSRLNHLKDIITPWLEGTNSNKLVYDSTWGGIVSTNGANSAASDFGQGYYNDHHFHYGYFLYALAVIGKYDISFINQHKDAVLDLARDIANPSTQDTYFTKLRQIDWYNGHSWASGIFEFGDAKNQESTSEAINGWYGLALLGEVLGNDEMKNLGRMLMATEIRGTKKYWHITSQSDIYPDAFKQNKAIVGILWSSKVDYTTWFGGNLEFVYGIQMLPFTPATELFLDDTDWVSEAYGYLENLNAGQEWNGFLLSFLAIVDKPRAWQAVQQLTAWDNGNSRTNTYYWVATRPGSSPGGSSGPGRIPIESFIGREDTSAPNFGGQSCGNPQSSNDGNLADLQIASDSGFPGGCNVGWVDAGESLSYNIAFSSRTSYTLSARVATPVSGTKRFSVFVDNVRVGSGQFQSTGAWQNYQWAHVSMGTVSAGSHQVKIVFDTSSFNMHFFEIEPTTSARNANSNAMSLVPSTILSLLIVVLSVLFV